MSNPSDNPILLTLGLRPGEGAAGISLAVGEGEIVAVGVRGGLLGTRDSGLPGAVGVTGGSDLSGARGVVAQRRSDDDVSRTVAADVAKLLRCLAGAEAAVDGQLWINGVAVHLLGWDARVRLSRTRCAVLLRADRLLPELSVVENVALPLLLAGVRPSQARRRAADWLARLEATDFENQKPKSLNPAAYRRVTIARSLVTDPVLLFIDEPLAGLDAVDRRHLLRILRASAGPHRLSLVVATQDAAVADWADRAISLGSNVPEDAAALLPAVMTAAR